MKAKQSKNTKKTGPTPTASSPAALQDRRGTWVYVGFSVYPEHALSAGHVPSAEET